jgi:hypothetical protein
MIQLFVCFRYYSVNKKAYFSPFIKRRRLYLFNGDKQQENHNAVHVAENGQCMYWTGDHYLVVSCKQVHGDTPVAALTA